MNLFYTIRSEWIKLRTTKAFFWTTLLFMGLGLLVPILVAWGALESEGNYVDLSLLPLGVYYFGINAIIVQAIMVVTSEYRHNSIGTTFSATPQRLLVMFSKWILYVVIACALTFATMIIGFYLVKLIGGTVLSEQIDVWNDETLLRMMWVYPLITFLVVTFCMGIAMVVRQTAGAVAIVLVWFLGFEKGLYFIPKQGPKLSQHGPFSNLEAFVNRTTLTETAWDYTGSLYYFMVWAFGFLLLGLLLVRFRDA